MDIQITPRAIEKLQEVASEENINLSETVLSVAVVQGGCSGLTYEMGWDTTVQDSDEVSEMGGLRVVMDLKSQLYLEGTELDFSDGLEGKGFHFSNPQAARTCAGGEYLGV